MFRYEIVGDVLEVLQITTSHPTSFWLSGISRLIPGRRPAVERCWNVGELNKENLESRTADLRSLRHFVTSGLACLSNSLSLTRAVTCGQRGRVSIYTYPSSLCPPNITKIFFSLVSLGDFSVCGKQ